MAPLRLIPAIIAVSVFVLSSSFAADSGDSKIKQLAAVRALQQSIEGLRGFRSETVVESMRERMLASPEQYRSRDRSRALLEEWYRQEELSYVEGEKKGIFEEFGEEGNAFSPLWLGSYMEENTRLTASLRDIMEENRKSVSAPAFDHARELAVQEQWNSINFGAYPEADEVENLSKKGSSEIKSIVDRLERETRGKVSFFEENTRSLESVIQRVLEDAVYQFNGQLEALQSSSGGSHLSEPFISIRISEDIERFVSGLEKIPGRHIYPLFPSISAAVAPKASRLVQEKLLAYAEGPETANIISDDQIQQAIGEDIAGHKTLVDSIIKLHGRFIGTFTDTIIHRYQEKVRNADSTADGAVTWIGPLLSRKKGEADLVGSRLLALLAEKTPPIRDSIAQEQLTQYFHAVTARTWEIPEKIIVEYYLTENDLTYTKRYKKRTSIEIDELSTLLPVDDFVRKKSLLLDEALEKLRAAINSDLLREGYRALAKQITIIDSHREDMRGKIRQSLARDRSDAIYANLFKVYRYDVQSKWSRERRSLSPPLGDKYSEVFIYSEDLIRNLIHFDVDEVNNQIEDEKRLRETARPEAEDRKAEIPPPPDHPPAKKGKGKSEMTCEERLSACEQELDILKKTMKNFKKGMI